MKKVTEFLYRGPRPSSFKQLTDAGIGGVIYLESGAYEFFTDDQYERDRMKSQIPWYDLGCSDLLPPEEGTVRSALELIRRFEEIRRQRLYIHCKSGVDRTGFIVAAFRMRVQGWTFKQAHAEWIKEGRHWWYWWWKYELKQWESRS